MCVYLNCVTNVGFLSNILVHKNMGVKKWLNYVSNKKKQMFDKLNREIKMKNNIQTHKKKTHTHTHIKGLLVDQ